MTFAQLRETAEFLRNRLNHQPMVGLVLGSGLGAFVNEIQVQHRIPYTDIPNFVPTTVEGHEGNLISGTLAGKNIVALQGRWHFYEGHPMETVVFPTRVLALLGIQTLVLTNSAGGLAEGMAAGDFMIIDDHINFMGSNPLMGPNMKELGPRFPDMSEAYDLRLREVLRDVLKANNIRYFKGVYGGLSGPTYETPAEVRFLKMAGCSAVGMSTVPECIAANHLGLRVVALSCITNLAAGISKQKLNHAEVTETAKRVERDFSRALKELVSAI